MALKGEVVFKRIGVDFFPELLLLRPRNSLFFTLRWVRCGELDRSFSPWVEVGEESMLIDIPG